MSLLIKAIESLIDSTEVQIEEREMELFATGVLTNKSFARGVLETLKLKRMQLKNLLILNSKETIL